MNISIRLTPQQSEAIARFLLSTRNGTPLLQEDYTQALDTLSLICCQAAFHRALSGKSGCKACVKVLEMDRKQFTQPRRALARRRGNCGP